MADSGGKMYGYGHRPDMPDRKIPAPMQAVPRNAWPRDVANAVKNPGEATSALQCVQELMQADATAMVGIAGTNVNDGGTGSTTITNGYYWTDIARWCRYVEVVSTGADNKRHNHFEIALNISPLALLDPAQPFAPWIHWFEDICAARLVSPSAGHTGGFYFGLTWENAIGVTLAAPVPFIGIYAHMNAAAYGTWYARCVNDSGTGLDQSLGITTELPHRLAFGIDGRGAVHFAIDGELLLSYTTTGSDLGTHNAFDNSLRWSVQADDSATIRAGMFMDMQSIFSVEVLDEVA